MHDLFFSSFFQVKNLKTNMPADQITYSEKYNDEKYEYRYDKINYFHSLFVAQVFNSNNDNHFKL